MAWLQVAMFGLGLLLLFLGFAPWIEADAPGADGFSAYTIGVGLTPAMSFVVGALALVAMLPGGSGRAGPLPPVLALALTLGQIFSIFALPDGVDMAVGGILATVFNLFLTIAAGIAYYLEVRRPRPPFQGYQNPAAYPPPGHVPPHHP